MADLNVLSESTRDDYPIVEPWSLREALAREKASLGFYVSGHPLDRYGEDLSRTLKGLVPTSALQEMEPLSRVHVAGMVEDYKEKVFHGGGRKAFFILEDKEGRIDVKVRERRIDACAHALTSGEPVLITGHVAFPDSGDDGDGPRDAFLLCENAILVADAVHSGTAYVALRVHEDRAKREHLEKLLGVLRRHPGECTVKLIVVMKDGTEAGLLLARNLAVDANDAMIAEVEKIFG